MYNEEEHIEPEFMKQHGANPFRVPNGYFDSLDDRIMKKIQVESETKSRSLNVVRLLKPVLAVAASILLVYLLTNAPLTKNHVSSQLYSNAMSTVRDDSTMNFSLIDESTLVNAIFTDDKSTSEEVNSEDMLAYLSSGLNEVQIYSEMQNK
jgi:hypothetical protein